MLMKAFIDVTHRSRFLRSPRGFQAIPARQDRLAWRDSQAMHTGQGRWPVSLVSILFMRHTLHLWDSFESQPAIAFG